VAALTGKSGHSVTCHEGALVCLKRNLNISFAEVALVTLTSHLVRKQVDQGNMQKLDMMMMIHSLKVVN